MEIMLNVQITFSTKEICTILILTIHKHWGAFPSPSIFFNFFQCLKVLLTPCFTSLGLLIVFFYFVINKTFNFSTGFSLTKFINDTQKQRKINKKTIDFCLLIFYSTLLKLFTRSVFFFLERLQYISNGKIRYFIDKHNLTSSFPICIVFFFVLSCCFG